ncbi:4-(cytidine 5'-diphospho)-2-C-methyl-D-erythritol kinase [Rickettsiales bacterium LUAb2]
MSTAIFFAPAKLNLFLKVLNKNSSNYHELQSFVVFVNLFDQLELITNSDSNNISLNITGPYAKNIPTNSDNLVTKIAYYFKQQFNINKGIIINLTKNIPSGAGLGGGSSDAATTLLALNKLWDINLSFNELLLLGLKFGADIPACLHKTSGIMEGIGEKFTPYKLNFTLNILLVNPNKVLDTKAVFTKLNYSQNNMPTTLPQDFNHNYNSFLNFIKLQPNDLTNAAIDLCPEVKLILQDFNHTNCIFSKMTGSGSTCFAIYKNKDELLAAKTYFEDRHPSYFIFAANSIN